MPKASPQKHLAEQSSDSSNTPATFEAALSELESIVQTMEQGNAPLEAQLSAYERGATLLRYCQDALAGAEQKIRVLEGESLREFEPGSGNDPA